MRSMMLRLLLLSAVVAAVGCLPLRLPAILVSPGVTASAVAWEKTTLASFDAERVMHLGWDREPAVLRVITEWRVRQLDVRSGSYRDAQFPHLMFLAAPVTMGDGTLRIAGYSDRGRLLSLAGTPEGSFDGRQPPRVANVTGDAGDEVLMPKTDGMRVYSPAGALLRNLSIPRSAFNTAVIQADADPELEIAFVETRGAALSVGVVNADGTIVSEWRSDDGTWLSSVPALGTDRLWGLTKSGFAAFDARGTIVERYPADGVDFLQQVTGTRAGGYVALLATGTRGGRRSMLCIYDGEKRLIYQEVYDALAWAVTSDPTSGAIVVGAGTRVYRYALTRSEARSSD
jgi:hypothetical protein